MEGFHACQYRIDSASLYRAALRPVRIPTVALLSTTTKTTMGYCQVCNNFNLSSRWPTTMSLTYHQARTDQSVTKLLWTVLNDFKLLLKSPVKSPSPYHGSELLPPLRQILDEYKHRHPNSVLRHCTPRMMFNHCTLLLWTRLWLCIVQTALNDLKRVLRFGPSTSPTP